MRMRIVEARKNGLESEVNFARVRGGQGQHLSVRAYGQKSRATDGHGLGSRLGWIFGPDVSVVQNDFRLLCARERQRQQAAHALEEMPSREWWHRDGDYIYMKRQVMVWPEENFRDGIQEETSHCTGTGEGWPKWQASSDRRGPIHDQETQ